MVPFAPLQALFLQSGMTETCNAGVLGQEPSNWIENFENETTIRLFTSGCKYERIASC